MYWDVVDRSDTHIVYWRRKINQMYFHNKMIRGTTKLVKYYLYGIFKITII